MEIRKIDLGEELQTYNAPAEVKKEITDNLQKFFDKCNEWEATIKNLVIKDPSEVGKMKMAREGRLALREYRLEARDIVAERREKLKTEMSAFMLQDKLYMHSWKIIEESYKYMEGLLLEKEKFAERWHLEQREKLRNKRMTEVLSVDPEYQSVMDLATMDDEVYEALLSGLRQKALLKKQEEERLKKEFEAKQKLLLRNDKRREHLFDKGFTWDGTDFVISNTVGRVTFPGEDVINLEDKPFKTKVEQALAKAAELEQKEEQAAKEAAEQQRRKEKMFELGLKWDGEAFTFGDINFHWTDLATMTTEAFNKEYEGAKVRKGVIEAEALKAKEAEEKEAAKQKKLLAEKEEQRKLLQKQLEEKEKAEKQAKIEKERQIREAEELARKEAAAPDATKLENICLAVDRLREKIDANTIVIEEYKKAASYISKKLSELTKEVRSGQSKSH
jgi:hypothetical protein